MRERLLAPFQVDNGVKDRLQGGLGLLPRHSGLEAAKDVNPPAPALVEIVPAGGHLPLHHDWDADLRRGPGLHSIESFLADADDGELMIVDRSEEHTSELQSPCNLVCSLLL